MNFKKIVYFAFFAKDKDKVNKIISYLNNDKDLVNKNYQFETIIEGSDDEIILFDNLKAKIIAGDYLNYGIVLDDYGLAASMYLNKFNQFIVASLTDEHSGYMTKLHNNSNVISLGFKNVTLPRIKLIIKEYLISEFENGRHMVRIDMLNKIC